MLNGKIQDLLVKNKTQGIMIKMLETEKQENREEEVESQVVEMEPAEEGLEVEATPSVPSTNFRVMDMYLHKVLGYPPWGDLDILPGLSKSAMWRVTRSVWSIMGQGRWLLSARLATPSFSPSLRRLSRSWGLTRMPN